MEEGTYIEHSDGAAEGLGAWTRSLAVAAWGDKDGLVGYRKMI